MFLVSKKKNTIRAMKCHTYHMLASLGAMTEVANYPRGLNDPSNDKIVEFVREHTAAHRLIVKSEITEEVCLCNL